MQHNPSSNLAHLNDIWGRLEGFERWDFLIRKAPDISLIVRDRHGDADARFRVTPDSTEPVGQAMTALETLWQVATDDERLEFVISKQDFVQDELRQALGNSPDS